MCCGDQLNPPHIADMTEVAYKVRSWEGSRLKSGPALSQSDLLCFCIKELLCNRSGRDGQSNGNKIAAAQGLAQTDDRRVIL
jgi:hypothetical protein